MESFHNQTLPNQITTGTYYSYSIPGMDITPGPIIYTLVSQFLNLVTPTELPLGQIHYLLYRNLTAIEFAIKAIKIESGFIVLMSIFSILALVPFIATCSWCCSRRSPDDDYIFHRTVVPIIIDDSVSLSLQCRKKASIITLWIIFIMLTLCDLSIFYANSRLATTIEMAPEMYKSTVHDIEVFLKDTHLQIKHKLDNGFHVSIEKVIKDLEDVDVLLGEPIQAEISAHTGLELAYDSLATITLANAELIYRVLMLQETVGRALKLSQEATARMEELQIQLSVLQRQCTYRDRPLCDTLRIRSFEENGIIDALKALQEDQAIFRMRYLGEIEVGSTVRNLSSEVGMSRSIFGNFPQQVKHDTAYERNYTLEQLEGIRHRTTANAKMLTATINALLERLQGTWETLQPKYSKLKEWMDIYWTIGWATALVIIWIALFMIMSYCCFLCGAHVKAGIVLFIAVIVVCVSSVCICVYGVVSLAIGGNTEVFLCRPLYDDNTDNAYDMLGKLFDKPGYVYRNEPQTGIIGELLRPNDVKHAIVNVSLAAALRGCKKNEASYNVFQLDAFVNTTAISNLKQFPKVTKAIDSIVVSERTLLSLTQTIQNILENMVQISAFNLSTYRTSIGAPTPEKDLATFIDQMQRVALQIQDVATSSRMTTLGSRSKRLQASILQPLEQQQNEILYHLTALELQRDPWAKQINQAANHLRNVQDYLEKTAAEICQNQTRLYTDRLKTYLTNSKATMSSQLGDSTAKCRPFFDIFDANRTFICRNMVDFINSLWFFTFVTLLLWSIGTPVCLNLITLQRKMNSFKNAKSRTSDRSAERRVSPKDQSMRSSPRDRFINSGTRSRPQLNRSGTEETLKIAEETPSPSTDQRQRSREQIRELRQHHGERERERRESRLREVNAPGQSRNHLRQQSVESEGKWVSRGANSGTSFERDYSQPMVPTVSGIVQRQQQQQKQQRQQHFQQQTAKSKSNLRRQGTEDEDMEFDDENVCEDKWRSKTSLPIVGPERKRSEPCRSPTSENRSPTTPSRLKRSLTPVLASRPDAQPAQPLPQTPTRLKNRVSLTTRQIERLTKGKANQHKKVLSRSNTEEFPLDEADNYASSSRTNTAAFDSFRRTPPRLAPPPPPPPAHRYTLSSTKQYQQQQRSVRWNEDNVDDDELVFEACN